MKTKLLKNRQGFTIIEVMIVLAIAAIIMVIVFLAVPNLQRNSRNTQRKTDANNVLSIIGEYKGNNNGTLPACARFDLGPPAKANVGGGANPCPAGDTTVVTTNLSSQISTLTLYADTTVAGATTVPADNSTIKIVEKAVCSATNVPVATTTGGSAVVFYAVEPGLIAQCRAG